MINLNTGRSYPLELIQLDQLLVNILQPYEQHIKQENRTLEVNFAQILCILPVSTSNRTYFDQFTR